MQSESGTGSEEQDEEGECAEGMDIQRMKSLFTHRCSIAGKKLRR